MTDQYIASVSDRDGLALIPSACPLKGAAVTILRRTATYLASTPGGLRFVAGSREWLQGLPGRAAGERSSSASSTSSI